MSTAGRVQALFDDPDVHLFDLRRVENGPKQRLGVLQAKHRLAVSFIARGMSNQEVSNALAERGVFYCPNSVGILRSQPLVRELVAKLLDRVEETVIKEVAEITEICNDALDLAHKAIKTGVIETPVLDENGNLVPGAVVLSPVLPKDRLKVASDMLDRHPSTAKVTRAQTSSFGGALSQFDADDLLGNLRTVRAEVVSARNGHTPETVLDSTKPSDDEAWMMDLFSAEDTVE